MYLKVTGCLATLREDHQSNWSVNYINKPEYVVESFVALIMRLRFLFMLYTNFSLSLCLR